MAINATLRAATEADVPAMAALEQLAFERLNWPADTFLRYECTVAECNGLIIGFLVARQIFAGSQSDPPEREILNLAVDPSFRRMGLATQLLEFELQQEASFLLEVRISNHAARSLYERFGFAEISQRHDYYDHPPEAAIVMLRKAKTNRRATGA